MLPPCPPSFLQVVFLCGCLLRYPHRREPGCLQGPGSCGHCCCETRTCSTVRMTWAGWPCEPSSDDANHRCQPCWTHSLEVVPGCGSRLRSCARRRGQVAYGHRRPGWLVDAVAPTQLRVGHGQPGRKQISNLGPNFKNPKTTCIPLHESH